MTSLQVTPRLDVILTLERLLVHDFLLAGGEWEGQLRLTAYVGHPWVTPARMMW
jgi:hypothetical protein